ncbi:MAG: hypothetical protein JNL88_01525 [Bacteroidia bacterium]|nr:hypothetical protein [Bacteroidia bacterium]
MKVEGVQNGNSIYYFFLDDFELYENSSDYPRWMTGLGSQRPCEIIVDGDDNVYFAGYANHEITYPNGFVQGLPNTVTGFIASYDPCGNMRWANNSNTPSEIYTAVSFDDIANRLLVASQTISGTEIQTYDPTSGSLLTTIPVPGSIFADEIVTSKTDANRQNWYILYRENGTGFYYFVRYNIMTNTIIGPDLVPGIQNITDFSINSLLTGNVNRIFLNTNSNSTCNIIDYTIFPPNSIASFSFIPANGNQTEDIKFTTIDQNNTGMLCIGGYYSNCDLTFNSNVIVPNVPQGTAGLWSNAFAFLFNPSTASFISGSGRYIGGNGDSRTTKIIATPNGDFIAAGLVNTSNVNVPTNTNFSSGWTPNPNSRGLFITKLDGSTGTDRWLKQGTSTLIGTWQKDLVCGNNGVIYGLGYLNGTINFLQGDTWTSTSQCDNTYVLKIQETGNNAAIERISSYVKQVPWITSAPTIGYRLTGAAEFIQLLEDQKYISVNILDFSGRIICSFKSNAALETYWHKLVPGCYIIDITSSNNHTSFYICK